MQMTEMQCKRTATMFGEWAKEPVKVEQIGGAVYGYGSELACLRIFAKYNANGAVPNPKVRVGYSTNLGTFYVSLEQGS